MEWISVKDKLPPQYDIVLISDGKVIITSYFEDGDFVGKEIDIQASYWMPFPELPIVSS